MSHVILVTKYCYNKQVIYCSDIYIACITQEKLLHAPQLSYECRRLYNEHDKFHYISQEIKKGRECTIHVAPCNYESRSLYSEHDECLKKCASGRGRNA